MSSSEQNINNTQLRNSWDRFIGGNDTEIRLLYCFYCNKLLLNIFLITQNKNIAKELLMKTLLLCQREKAPFQDDMENFLMDLLKHNYS